MFEQNEPKHALVYYENGLKILQNDIEENKSNKSNNSDIIPPEILLNVGTLRLEVGKKQEAYESFTTAIKNC